MEYERFELHYNLSNRNVAEINELKKIKCKMNTQKWSYACEWNQQLPKICLLLQGDFMSKLIAYHPPMFTQNLVAPQHFLLLYTQFTCADYCFYFHSLLLCSINGKHLLSSAYCSYLYIWMYTLFFLNKTIHLLLLFDFAIFDGSSAWNDFDIYYYCRYRRLFFYLYVPVE